MENESNNEYIGYWRKAADHDNTRWRQAQQLKDEYSNYKMLELVDILYHMNGLDQRPEEQALLRACEQPLQEIHDAVAAWSFWNEFNRNSEFYY